MSDGDLNSRVCSVCGNVSVTTDACDACGHMFDEPATTQEPVPFQASRLNAGVMPVEVPAVQPEPGSTLTRAALLILILSVAGGVYIIRNEQSKRRDRETGRIEVQESRSAVQMGATSSAAPQNGPRSSSKVEASPASEVSWSGLVGKYKALAANAAATSSPAAVETHRELPAPSPVVVAPASKSTPRARSKSAASSPDNGAINIGEEWFSSRR